MKENIIQVNKEKKIIIEYSLKKNNTNPALPYSILNPEINSLSPSEKSNGARLVSEIKLINQQKKIGITQKNNNSLKFMKEKLFKK